MTHVVKSFKHIKRDYRCLKAICSFCILCLKIMGFLVVCFVLQLKEKKVSFQKKKNRCSIPETRFLYFLGIDASKVLYSQDFHSQPKLQGTEQREISDLMVDAEEHIEKTYV